MWRAYLLLSRVSNLPTVWSNVVAALVVCGATPSWRNVAGLAAAMSLLYTSGMFLNDAFDREFDARHRRDRPLPAGDVTLRAVFVTGFVLMAAGIALVALLPGASAAVPWTVVLAGAIVLYDRYHKQNPWGPLVMGTCRGLIYVVVAAATVGAIGGATLMAALVQTGYVLMLSVVAKRLGSRASIAVPLLLAGISLLDATIILLAGGPATLAAVAASGFVLTLLFQRYVPGT